MPLALDHIVILVNDLSAAIASYSSLGFQVRPGGTHADGSTHNALVGFADGSYLELIAFLKPAPGHRWWRFAQAGRQGFVDFALLPDSVGAVVAGAQGRGLAYAGPQDGGRLRPDGERLQWQIGTPPSPDLPFLCGDVTPRHLRVPEGAVRVHANGVQGVATVTLLVADLDTSLARYQALLGTDADTDGDGAQAVSAAGLGQRQALLALGSTALLLVAPGPEGDASAPLRQRLQAQGEGVIGLALRGPPGVAAQALPLAATHGAAFETVPG